MRSALKKKARGHGFKEASFFKKEASARKINFLDATSFLKKL